MTLCTGIFKIWFWSSRFDFPIRSLTLLTIPLWPLCHDLCNYCHWLFISFTVSFQENHVTRFKILLLVISFLSEQELTEEHFFHLSQNLFAMCWTLLHLRLLKMSGLSKTADSKITFDFVVRMLAGANGAGLFTSLIVSTVNGCQFNIASHSTTKGFLDSVSRLLSWLLCRAVSTSLVERICLSQISPKWLVFGEFFFQTI